MKNWEAASDLINAQFASKPFDYWREHLKTMSGQWAPVLDLMQISRRRAGTGQRHAVRGRGLDGGEPIKLVRGPIQFNHEPVKTTRAPEASEHTEIVLMEMGLEWDRIESLKVLGAIA